jgi:hypothetical protein
MRYIAMLFGRYFGGTCCIHLQRRKMEAAGSSLNVGNHLPD